jgi:PAS domain S-box-containing protein
MAQNESIEVNPRYSAEIIAGMPLPTWVMKWETPPDPNTFVIVSANDAAARLIDKPLNELIGQRFGDSFPASLRESIPPIAIDVIERRKPQRCRVDTDEGTGRVYDVSMFTIEPFTIAIIAEDITGEHRRETQLREESGAAANAQEAAEGARDRAVTKTRRAEERFELLVSRVKDYAIFMLDPQGHIISWNEGAERIKGYSAPEIIGKHISQFYTPEDAAAGRPGQLLAIAERDGRVEEEGWRVRKNGERFWADVVITALRDDKGELRGFGKVTRDLTDKREAELARAAAAASEKRYELLVSRVRDYAIFMLDPNGNVASWNEGAQRIKGYTADEIIGKHMSAFYTSEAMKAGHPKAMLKRALAEGRVEEEGWRVRKDGTKFWADVLITALRNEDGDLVGFAKVTRDLTERREAELALGELSGRLMQTQDEERRRLARELHDSTSPLLTGLTAKLYAIKQRLQAGRDDPVAMLLEDAITNAEATSTVVRTVSSMLHPPLLDESGLLPSLKWYLQTYAKRTDVKIESKLPNSMERLSRDADIALFRIVQESVGNIMRQLGSRRIQVTMTVDGSLDLSIRGDSQSVGPGVVADLRAGRGEGGLTVAGMRERLRQLGGSLDFGSEDGVIEIRVKLPLRSE